MSNIFYESKENAYYFPCPQCCIKKEDIKCTIFRHAVFKNNHEFVPSFT